jgi:hypothetical protein
LEETNVIFVKHGAALILAFSLLGRWVLSDDGFGALADPPTGASPFSFSHGGGLAEFRASDAGMVKRGTLAFNAFVSLQAK